MRDQKLISRSAAYRLPGAPRLQLESLHLVVPSSLHCRKVGSPYVFVNMDPRLRQDLVPSHFPRILQADCSKR
jgi:hypothetical protein